MKHRNYQNRNFVAGPFNTTTINQGNANESNPSFIDNQGYSVSDPKFK